MFVNGEIKNIEGIEVTDDIKLVRDYLASNIESIEAKKTRKTINEIWNKHVNSFASSKEDNNKIVFFNTEVDYT